MNPNTTFEQSTPQDSGGETIRQSPRNSERIQHFLNRFHINFPEDQQPTIEDLDRLSKDLLSTEAHLSPKPEESTDQDGSVIEVEDLTKARYFKAGKVLEQFLVDHGFDGLKVDEDNPMIPFGLAHQATILTSVLDASEKLPEDEKKPGSPDDNQEKQAKMSELERQNQELRKQNQELRRQNEALSAKVDQLQREVSELSTQVTSLQKQVAELTDALNRLLSSDQSSNNKNTNPDNPDDSDSDKSPDDSDSDKNLDDSNNNDQLDNEEEEDRDSEGKYRLLRALGYNVGFYGMKLIRRIRKRLPSKESAESELSVSIPHEKISKEAEIIFDGLDPLTRKVYIQDYKHDGGEDEGVNEYDYDAMDDSAGMPEVFDFSGRDPGVLSKFMQDQIEELYNNPNPRSGRVIALVEEKLGGRALYFDPLQQKWLEVEGGYSDHQPIPYHPDSLADSKAREAIVDTEVRAANSRAERSGSELGRSIWQKGWEGLRSWKDSRKLNKIARNQLLDQAKEGGLRFSPDPSSRFGLDKDGRSFLGQLNALVRRGGAIIRGQEEVIQIPRGSTYADILKLINNGASPDDVQDSKGLVTPTNKESQDIEMPYTEEDIKLDPNVFSQRGLCTPEAQWDIVDDQGVILYRFGRSDLDQLSLDIAKANNSILDSSSMQQAIARGMVEAIRNILEAKEVQIGTHVKVRIYNKM